MQYNIHPLIVHFPIALLFVYSLIKILPVNKWFPKLSWNSVRLVLITFGVLGAFVALSTGEVAEHLVKPNHDLVETHASLASLSTWIFALLFIGELIISLKHYINAHYHNLKFKKLLFGISNFLNNKYTSFLLALIGLIAISLTGMLGGVMVYGVSADPLAPTVLKIFGISI